MSAAERREYRERKKPLARPGQKRSPEQVLARRQREIRRIDRELAHAQFVHRIGDWRSAHLTWPEIAEKLTEETGEKVSAKRVRETWGRESKNLRALDDLRWDEYGRLEAVSKKLREQIDAMEAVPEHLFVIEDYVRLTDSYLKYRDRTAKLLGLDQGGINGRQPQHPKAIGTDAFGKDVFAPPGVGDGTQVHIHLPGSVGAFKEWEALEQKGLTELADQVLELESSEADVDQFHPEGDGVTLAPHADVTPGAEREPTSSLEALELMRELPE